MTLARRLAFVASLTAAGAAGVYRWWARSVDRACACIGRHGPVGEWVEVDTLLSAPMSVESLTPPNTIYVPGWPRVLP